VNNLARVKFSTTLDENLLYEVKRQALNERKDANDVLEEILREKYKNKEIKGGKEKWEE
jgi:hypothetical protein